MHTARYRRFFIFALLLLSFLLKGLTAQAAVTLLEKGEQKIPLHNNFQLFEDTTAKLDIQDILSPEIARQFKPLSKNLSAGYSESAFWLRLDLQRSSADSNKMWLLEMMPIMLDDIRMYRRGKDGSMEIQRAGDHIAFSQQEIRHHYPIFKLYLQDTETTTVYLRIQSTSSVFFRAVLWTPNKFTETSDYIASLMGIYYGVMLAMIIYNAILLITYRDISMFYYLLLSFGTLAAGMSINGHIGMFIAPDWPWLVDIMPALLPQLIILVSSLFISSFLRLKETMPFFYKAFKIMQVMVLIFIALILAGYNTTIAEFVQLVGLVQVIFFLPICFLAGLRGYLPGYIVCVASVSWVVSIFLLPLRNLGILESSWITDYGFQIGSAMEAILLALAQAYRISLIKKESVDIQRQLLKISQQAEYELEAKVQLRTAELDDAVQRMKLLDKEKDDILGIAAHDLKNPLTSIIGMSDLLRKMRHQISEEQQHQYLERISNSGQRMMHIVTNLLDVNALESGHFHLSAQTVDFGQLLRDIIQQYESALKAKKLHTVVDIDSSVFVTADLNACIRIFDNLLSNAIKFSPAEKTIWLTISQHNGMGRFELRDEGPGLSGEDQQHLFTKFSKLSPTPTAGEHSSGLGLSIVKKLSEAQDGCVRCVSTLGAGTSFMVELPLAAVSLSQVQVLTGT